MRIEDERKPRSIRGKTPVKSSIRDSRNLAPWTHLRIERGKDVIGSCDLAENAQLRRSPRTLVIGDSVIAQNQPGRPSG